MYTAVRPAFAAQPPSTQASIPSTQPPATDPSTPPEISVRPDGSIGGVDGMLDQISASLARQIVPAIRDTVLPSIQSDRQLQVTVGRAAGIAIGQQLAKPLWALAIIAGAYAVWKIHRLSTQGPDRPKVIR